jgi:hypothetical protein
MTSKLSFMVTQAWMGTLGVLTRSRRRAPERVLVTLNGAGLVEHRVRARDELVVRLRAPQLDRGLCRGEPPETSVALALRAQRLVRPAARRDLARTLRRAMVLADHPPSRTGVRACRSHVRATNQELRDLCDRLLAGGPVSAYGVAQLRALLADGCGPLYQRRSSDDLGARLRRALAALDVLGPPTAKLGGVRGGPRPPTQS